MDQHANKWIIVDNNVIKVNVIDTLDFRCLCVDENGKEHVVSSYDVYEDFDAAMATLNEELPS